jgi:uncharacterized protein
MHKRFIREEELLLDAFRLAVRIFASGYRPSCILGLWPGGAAVGVYVQECLRHLGVVSNHAPLRVHRGSHDGDAPTSGARVDGLAHLDALLKPDDRVLIVDDVWATGASIDAVKRSIAAMSRGNRAPAIAVATIWYRPSAAHSQLHSQAGPDHFLYQTDDWLVMPCEIAGLTMQEIAAQKAFLLPLL